MTRLIINATIDFTGYSDFWRGHGHAFEDRTLVACLRFGVSINYSERITELIDSIMLDVNGQDWEIIDSLHEEKIRNITNRQIRKALKDCFTAHLNSLAFPELQDERQQFEQNSSEISEYPSCIGWIHVFKRKN